MKVIFSFLLTSLLLSCQSMKVEYKEGAVPQGPETYSPSLHELFAKLPKASAREQSRIFQIWKEWLGQKPIPLMEGRQVTYLYFDETHGGEKRIQLRSSFNNFSEHDYLYQLKGTSLYYKSYHLEADQLGEYYFMLELSPDNLARILDPLNPRVKIGRLLMKTIEAPPSDRGTLELIPRVKAQEGSLIASRDLYVYLPPEYHKDTTRRYPVFYVQDGQNLWDSEGLPYGGWKLDTVADRLIAEKKMEPIIIVGIPNSSKRQIEYMGASYHYLMEIPASKEKERSIQIKTAEDYRDFVTGTVKPLIDQNYRTLSDRNHTGIAGSSFGAGVSLYIGFSRSDVFSKIGALSAGHYTPEDNPGVWKDRPYNHFPFLRDKVLNRKNALQVWLDCGTIELDASFVKQARILKTNLESLGFVDGRDLKWVEEQGAAHNEGAWASRADRVLIYLFPPK